MSLMSLRIYTLYCTTTKVAEEYIKASLLVTVEAFIYNGIQVAVAYNVQISNLLLIQLTFKKVIPLQTAEFIALAYRIPFMYRDYGDTPLMTFQFKSS